MAIEVWNGSGWNNVSDPEIYDGANYVNIQKGEIYNGSGWSTFYQRFSGTVNTPTITLNSRTANSIIVNVTLPTGSPYKTQVTVYRTTNALGASNIPASPAVGAISGTKAETELSPNTSYTFSAYATYYDATTNELLQQSATVSETFSTLAYIITTPTTPSNSARTSSSLSFESTSNANYSTNNSAAYIEFEFYQLDAFSGWVYYTSINRNLLNNDSSQTLTATITGLSMGTTFRCRARTVYSSISETSPWSAYSAAVATKQYVTKYIPSSTTFAAGNNSTHFSDFASSGTSFKDTNRTYSDGSDGDTGTEWMSNPYETGTVFNNETRTINKLAASDGIFGKIVEYTTSATHNLTNNTSSYSGVTITSLIYPIIALSSTVGFIFVEIANAPASLSGAFSINGCSDSRFNRSYTVDTYTSLGFGIYRVRAVRPSTIPSGLTPAAPRGSALFTGSVNGFGISTLGGGAFESNIFTGGDNTKFTRNDTSATNIPETGAAGSVTYTVSSQGQVAKTDPNDEILRLAFQPNLPTGAINVQLEAIQTRCGGVASPRIVIEVNGGAATRTLTSGLAANTADTWNVPSNILPNTTNLGVSNCWYIALIVRSGTSGSLLYSTISEVQIRYSYQILE